MFAVTTTVDYRLSFADQGKQMFIFRFRLQKTNRSLPFPFAENKQKLPFPLASFSVCGIQERGDMDMETWNKEHGKLGTWRHDDRETWTRRHQTENGSPGDFFLKSVYRLLIVQIEVCRLSAC